ncbi:MAG TPA: DUF882 domain-containing protein [Polyangiaceae bacterium]
MRPVFSFAALALFVLVPAVASAAPPKDAKHARTARVQKTPKAESKTCVKSAIEVVGAGEAATFSLAKCDGTPVPSAVDELSILARPGSAPRPKVTVETLGKSHGPLVAPGVRRLDARLLERVEQAVDHFRKPGAAAKIQIVSGVRPKSAGSYHQSGRALDFRIDGVQNEALVAFCKTLQDTGCGYYPNSTFVHMDVRNAGAGHVAWIDVSRPGEPPKYVTAWPAPGDDPAKLPALPPDEQPSLSMRRPAGEAGKHPLFF